MRKFYNKLCNANNENDASDLILHCDVLKWPLSGDCLSNVTLICGYTYSTL